VYTQLDTELLSMMVCPRAPEDRAEIAAELYLFDFAFDDFMENAAHDKVGEPLATSRVI
jgi:hypothetical protein